MKTQNNRERVLNKTIIDKTDLVRFFGKNRTWIRRNVFTDEKIKQLGFSLSVYQNRKSFTVDESNRIRKYLKSIDDEI